jgi:hypothetical protein
MKVFLDDTRLPPDDSWTVVRTVQEALGLLAAGRVGEISLDDDLGENQPEGYEVANWIERMAFSYPSFRIPIVRVHTANLVARGRMLVIIGRIVGEARRRTER